MKLGKHEFKVRHPRFWLGLAAAVVCLLVVYLVWVTFFVQSTNPQPKAVPQPPTSSQQLKPSSFQETRRRFGPWKLVAPGSTGAPRLVMLDTNGGTEVSSKTVRVQPNWKQVTAFEITTVTAGKHSVRIRTTESRIFSLSYKQAFILEQRPDAVYGFLHAGPGKAKLVSTTVSALTKR